jgi:hypothetical protein
MRKYLKLTVTLSLIFCVIVLAGCGGSKAATSQEAVKIAQSLETKEAQYKYLTKQAESFLKEGKFKDSIDLSQYILFKLDPTSPDVKQLLRKAQDALAVQKQIQ